MRATALKTWNEYVPRLLESANDLDALTKILLEAVTSLSVDSVAAIIVFSNANQPTRLWTTNESIDLDKMTRAVSRAFQLDPLFAAFIDGRSGCLPLWEIAPKGFKSSACYKELYRSEGLFDEINHLTRIGDGRVVLVGNGNWKRKFTAKEIANNKAAYPVIAACSSHIARLVRTEVDDSVPGITQPVDGALEEFGVDVLTPREQDVIHLVLRGHSTESAAQQLGISWNTVKRHRLQAYSKLKVGSQGELFYEFLRTIGLRPDH